METALQPNTTTAGPSVDDDHIEGGLQQKTTPSWHCPLCEAHAPKSSPTTKSKWASLFFNPASTLGQPWWWGTGPRRRRVRSELAQFLEAHSTHIALLVLILIDLCVVLTELVLGGFYPAGEERPAAVETAEEALSWTSIAILSLFTIEQLVKLAVFGPRYFAHLWHALDATIIVASLVLEAILRGQAGEAAVSLLIVFRLWRLVRVLHSTTETMVVRYDERIEAHHKAELELVLEVQGLRQRLRAAGLDPGPPPPQGLTRLLSNGADGSDGSG